MTSAACARRHQKRLRQDVVELLFCEFGFEYSVADFVHDEFAAVDDLMQSGERIVPPSLDCAPLRTVDDNQGSTRPGWAAVLGRKIRRACWEVEAAIARP